MARLFWLSDEAWASIDPLLPHGRPGKPRVDDRRILSSILHVLKTGCRWKDCLVREREDAGSSLGFRSPCG